MAREFVRDQLVRFAHCDPAGIVFYPHYLVMVNDLVEDWFSDGLGFPFAEHLARGFGLPTVKLECNFVAPSRIGEVLSKRLAVTRIGTSSLTLSISFVAGEVERVRAAVVLVMQDLAKGRATPIPAELRERIEAFAER